MKIATYNVNSIHARLPVLLRWLQEDTPDVACLQELKTPDEKFPEMALNEAGYECLWHGQKSWNGVAILSRIGKPVEVARGLPGDPEDVQSRFLAAEVGGVTIVCLYLPNGNPAPGPKYDYKLRWMERFAERVEEWATSGKPVVLTGDYNVIPTEKDVYRPERWVNDALFRTETREAFQKLLAQGWTDALRRLFPEEIFYTYWDYFRGAFQRDAGLRIDHFLLNEAAMKRLQKGGVNKNVRGWEKSSDHTPVWITLTEEA